MNEETPDEPADPDEPHREFSAACFNAAWDLIDRDDRTDEDDEMMIHLAHASVCHWKQRDDCRPANLSIGYWQISRVYALVGEFENARKYARLSLETAPDDDPFLSGYACEALARAERGLGRTDDANESLNRAFEFAATVENAENRTLLEDDLNSLRNAP